jgi:hypothetical protein
MHLLGIELAVCRETMCTSLLLCGWFSKQKARSFNMETKQPLNSERRKRKGALQTSKQKSKMCSLNNTLPPFRRPKASFAACFLSFSTRKQKKCGNITFELEDFAIYMNRESSLFVENALNFESMFLWRLFFKNSVCRFH